jgi:hypothetical protein
LADIWGQCHQWRARRPTSGRSTLVPIFLFEVTMGVLLLFKSLPLGKREAART